MGRLEETVDQQSLRVLELEEVLQRVARHATWERGKAAVLSMRPLPDRDAVVERQEEMAEAMRLDQGFRSPPIRGVRDIGEASRTAAMGIALEPATLLDVAQTLDAAIRVRRFFQEKTDEVPRLSRLSFGLVAKPDVVADIGACIADDGAVKDDASDRLEGLRVQVRTLQNRIQGRIQGILRNPATAKMLQEPFVTMRSDRYVLPVKAEHRAQFQGIVLDASASGATVFMEPLAVVDLGNELRAAKAAEHHEVEAILGRLSARVGEAADAIEANAELLGMLDARMALARWAGEQRGHLVRVDERPVLHLRNARHPLLEARAVPIDVEVGDPAGLLVITGPNTGGKTVTLKTIGLMALMTACGMPVTAGEGTRIGFFRGVYADIGDEQSLQQNLSTFSAHLRQIARILPRAGPNVLVLLDEAGAGTDPREGTALAVSFLEHLHERGALVVATTHYNELKAFAAHFEGAANAAMEFDPETLQPTYRIRMGLPGRSLALEISARLGVPMDVLDRARALLGESHHSVEQLLTSLESERDEAARKHDLARQAHTEAEAARTELSDALRRVREERERLLRNAEREADALLEAARGEAKGLMKEARARIEALAQGLASQDAAREVDRLETSLRSDLAALGDVTHEVIDVLERQLEETLPTPPAEQPTTPVPETEPLTPGDVVFIPRLQQEGVVAESPRGDEVSVRLGTLTMRLPVADVHRKGRRAKESARRDENSFSPTWSATRLASVPTRLTLIGKRAEDATYELERYLEEATAAGVDQATIVHGKGTGVLQKVVGEVLRAHPRVGSFRLGEAGEGGWGVTVVTFK